MSGLISHVTLGRSRPLAAAWITLHRVGSDNAGSVDSIRSGADGRYSFRYRAKGDTNALYFVSSRFAGIAYFTLPLKDRVVTGEAADLLVYDTTGGPVPIRVRGRHIVVMAPDSQRSRRVVEVFELSNDSSVTRVSVAADHPTFETLLPDGAREPRAGDGEVTGDGLLFANGRARVLAPLAPGLKQFSFSYRLAADRRPVAFPSVAGSTVLEVLLEDEKGTVAGAGLREAAATTLDGRRFRRFTANDAPSAAVISVTAPTMATSSSRNARIALIVTALGAMLLLGLAAGMRRRDPVRARARRATTDDPVALEREIAALDVAFAALESPDADDRADHYESRARLKARLTAASARAEGLM